MSSRAVRVLAGLLLSCGVVFLTRDTSAPAPRGVSAHRADVARGGETLGPVPTAFVPNLGQWQHSARYVARFGAMSVLMEDRGWSVHVARPDAAPTAPSVAHDEAPKPTFLRGVSLRMSFAGAQAADVDGEDRLAGVHNYFLGSDPSRWRTDVPLYGSVSYRQLYPGVDLRAYDKERHFEYDLILAPGADLAQVDVVVEGATRLSIDGDGALVIDTAEGRPLRQPPPIAYVVEKTGRRHPVTCHHELRGPSSFGFSAGSRDPEDQFVVDPGLIYSTYLGGRQRDWIKDLAVDAAGVITAAGYSLSLDFPTTVGAWSRTAAGRDAYVTRLDPSLPAAQQLLYSTYLGSPGDDGAIALAVDVAGVVTVFGDTNNGQFPTTPGAWDTTFNSQFGVGDTFLARLDPRLTGAQQLVYSTFLGGTESETPWSLSVDSRGVATMAGQTGSTNYPTTSNAWSRSTRRAFVTQLDPSLPAPQQLLYSTYFGGPSRASSTQPRALRVDLRGRITLAGSTHEADFPTTPGAWDRTLGGPSDGFVAQLDPTLAPAQQLVYSTFLGGSGVSNFFSSSVNDLSVDSSGVITAVGSTGAADVPTTAGAWDRGFNKPIQGGNPAFVSQLNPSLPSSQQLIYSTFLGGVVGPHLNAARAVSTTASGVVFVAGYTAEPDFPTTAGAWDRTLNNAPGVLDGFVARLNPSLPAIRQLEYSTFLGGAGADWLMSMVVDASGVATVSGDTNSLDFPTTAGAWDTTFNGSASSPNDGFITRLALVPPQPASFTEFGVACAGTAGVPHLRAVAPPQLGTTFDLRVDNLLPFTFSILLVGASNTAWGALPLPLDLGIIDMPTCHLYVSGDVTFPLFNTNGSTAWTVTIPPDTGLIGVRFFTQCLPFDASANLRGVVASNAGEVLIGI